MIQELKGRKVSLQSGATLYVNAAKYADSEELLSQFLASVENMPSQFDEAAYTDLFSKIVVSRFFTRPELKRAAWRCLEYCIYVPAGKDLQLKVTPELFDPNGAGDRGDLAQVMEETARENIWPFLKGLWNASQNLKSAINATQKPSDRPEIPS
jgi:hypothetical protein